MLHDGSSEKRTERSKIVKYQMLHLKKFSLKPKILKIWGIEVESGAGKMAATSGRTQRHQNRSTRSTRREGMYLSSSQFRLPERQTLSAQRSEKKKGRAYSVATVQELTTNRNQEESKRDSTQRKERVRE